MRKIVLVGWGMPAAATQDAARGNASEFPVIVFDLAVNDGVVDAFGELIRLREGGAVYESCGIENGDVREEAGPELAAAVQVFALRGK